MSEEPEPLVFVVITNYNNAPDTEQTVRSFNGSTYKNLALCVIDNGSTDGSWEYLQPRLQNVQMLRSEVNAGVSRSYNWGIREGLKRGANYILIANNDIELEPDCVELLVREAECPGGADVLAPLMYYYHDRSLVWFPGGRVSKTEIFSDHCRDVDEFKNLPQEQRFITACAMLIRSSILEKTGGYDEQFFMYLDDTDFSMRVVQAGFRLDIVPAAKLYHKVGASSDRGETVGPFKAYHVFRSSLLFWRKHLGWWEFHRRYCGGHLGKWLNPLPDQWGSDKLRARAQAVIDALWYVVSFKKCPLDWPKSPGWFTRFVLRYPWVAAELLGFQFGRLLRITRRTP